MIAAVSAELNYVATRGEVLLAFVWCAFTCIGFCCHVASKLERRK